MAVKLLIGVVVCTFIFVFISIFSVIGINNTCVQMEAGIKAQYDQNRHNYDNMWKKFKEATQVTSMYTEDLKKVYDSAMQGRYGKDGSKAVFQWLQEHNPNFDSGMYKNLQVMSEGGRNAFEGNQKMLVDKKRQYEVEIQSFPTVVVARTLGFPKLDLNKFDIVTSDTTEETFKTKKADEIKLRSTTLP